MDWSDVEPCNGRCDTNGVDDPPINAERVSEGFAREPNSPDRSGGNGHDHEPEVPKRSINTTTPLHAV